MWEKKWWEENINRNNHSWIAKKIHELRALTASECLCDARKQRHTLSERTGRQRKILFLEYLVPWLECCIEVLLSSLSFLCHHFSVIPSASLQRCKSQFIPIPNVYHLWQNKRWENELYVQNSSSNSVKNRQSNSRVLEGKWVVGGRWLSSQGCEKLGEDVRRRKEGDSPSFSLGE